MRLSKSFSKARIYGYACGRIMVHEATFLDWQHIERMLESEYGQAVSVLLDTVYGPFLAGATAASEVEKGLISFLANEYGFIDEICSGTHVHEFLHMRYDYHNIRSILKKKLLTEDEKEAPIVGLGTIEPDEIERAIEGAAVSLPEFATEIIERVKVLFDKKEADSQTIDVLIDRAYLERRLKVAKTERSGMLIDFAMAAIDVANMKILVRGARLAKKQEFYEEALIEGGRIQREKLLSLAGNVEELFDKILDNRYGRMIAKAAEEGGSLRLTSLDRISDDYLLGELRKFSSVSVGPERIVRYMLTRETEVGVIRAILLGKLHNVPPQTIEARLPVAYLTAPVR